MFYLCLDTKNVGQLFLTMEKKIVEVASGGIQVKFNRNSKDLVIIESSQNIFTACFCIVSVLECDQEHSPGNSPPIPE